MLEQLGNGRFHIHLNAIGNRFILERAYQFKARTIAHMHESLIRMPAEQALHNAALLRAIKKRAP